MNLGGIAVSAFGGAIKDISQKDTSDNVRAVFRQDSFISGILMSAPAAVLSLLLLFSSDYFKSSLITCSLRDTAEYGLEHDRDYRSYRYDYSFFDYNFVQGYCYANMYNYQVNATGHVDLDSKESLVFLKLFPYVLSTYALLGGLSKIMWELYDRRHSSQLSLILDGIEEGVAELFAGLGLIYQKNESEREKNSKDLNVSNIKKRRRHTPGIIPSIIADNNLSYANEHAGAKVKCENIHKPPERLYEGLRKLNLKVNQREARAHIKEYSKLLESELEKIWAQQDTKTKFVELEDLMISKLRSFRVCGMIFFYRFVALMITVGCGASTYFYYCHCLKKHNWFNCYLPQTYWYTHRGPNGSGEEYLWKTTKCYIKSIVFWEYVSFLLFTIYAIAFMYQIGAHCRNVRSWRKSCKLIRYMPLQADDLVADFKISDLHCIMALAHENNRSRVTIWAGDKVTSALSNAEMYKFLPVMMEMIVWKSSDENIDHLVKNIVNKAD